MKKILLPAIAVLLSATAITAAQAAGTATTTTTHYHSETYYNWNPFAANTTGLYVAGQAGGSFPTDSSYDDDGAYAVSVGWQFHPMVRVELEAGYRNNDIGSAADADTYTYMLNAIWDIKNDTRFTPYIGAGAGWAYNNLEGPGGFDESENNFVYQGIAGVSYAIDNNWALTAQYNFVDTSDFDYAGASDDYKAHEVKAGVRYTF